MCPAPTLHTPAAPQRRLAARLLAAHQSGAPISPTVAETVPTLDAAEAVQDSTIAGLGPIGGWKLGATMASVRTALGVPRIFLGAVPAGRVILGDRLAGPWQGPVGIESEYAFRFQRDLPPGEAEISTDAVIAAIGSVHAAFEIPASRYVSGIGGEGGLMLVADNGAAGWLVIGEGREPAAIPDLVHAEVQLIVEGKACAGGTAAAIDGAPFEVITAFVRLAHARGYTVRAGQFVATGSCTGYTQVPLGMKVVAEFPHIGQVRAVFGTAPAGGRQDG